MKIEDLRPNRGARKRRKIVGRGPGSGHGKTSTRGHKGQMARTGKGKRPGFEGGQMPLIRRMPKRGFSPRPRKGYHIVKLDALKNFKGEVEITPDFLKDKGIIKGTVHFLKILGDGEIQRPLNIKAHAFSKSAIKKIEDSGGKWEVVKVSKSQRVPDRQAIGAGAESK